MRPSSLVCLGLQRHLYRRKNKITRNLIKVYSTMVSSVATIEETLNEIKKITNSKSQRKGTSAQSDGHFLQKAKNFIAQ